MQIELAEEPTFSPNRCRRFGERGFLSADLRELMPDEPSADSQLEIAHVLCSDIVGYSKLLTDQQRESIRLLNEVVRSTEQFRLAEKEEKLVRLPTGDGMALVFRHSEEEPARCGCPSGHVAADIVSAGG